MVKLHEMIKMNTMDQGPIGVTVEEEMIDLSAESIIAISDE